MDPIDRAIWSTFRPGNVHGFRGQPFELGIAFANTGGQDSSGADSNPIPPSNAGTSALGTAGVAYAGTPNAAFSAITTNLILRNVVEVLRTRPILMQQDAFVRARNVKGTTNFVYTMFSDLGAADTLLEGVPPVTVPLAWDTMSFNGAQKGKLVAITDLAEMTSPFDLYSIAAEKLAWNAVDTVEIQAMALITGANLGVAVDFVGPPAVATVEGRIIATVLALKKAEVPPFSDGNYRCVISPADAAVIMGSTATAGWTDVLKYTNATPILNAELGSFRGVRFLESNRVPDAKSVVFGPQFVAFGDYDTITAYRVPAGGDHADPLQQRALFGWKGMWGMQIAAFSGSPAAGPATNPKGNRYAQVDLTP